MATNIASDGIVAYAIATGAVVALYFAGAWAYRSVSGAQDSYSPVVLTAGKFRRGSLANLQVLFFSLVVIWVVALYIARGEGLVEFDSSVWQLLGIAVTGTGAARVTSAAKPRLSNENWAWLKNKGWIKKDITRSAANRRPQWSDLITVDGLFEVTRFQSFAFSLLVGFALIVAAVKEKLIAASTGTGFAVPSTYLFILGLSQIVYVGGIAVEPNNVAQLDEQLTKLRDLEMKFMDAVSSAWKTSKPAKADIKAAEHVAKTEYDAYMAAANLAATVVTDMTDNRITDDMKAPNIAY